MKETLKKYWWCVILVIGLFLYAEIRVHNVEKVLNTTIESNTAQINALKKGYEEEIKGREQIIKKHEEELKDINERYEEQSLELDRERAKKIKVIVKYYDNPEKLAEKITSTYGFKYEPITKNITNSH